MPEASLKRRYAVKLASNIASIPLFFAMEAILPRALGPAGYGNFSFATNLFQQLTNFLDMGSSNCLYAALSRRQTEFGLVAFYGRVAVLVLAACLILGLALLVPAAGKAAMPGVPGHLGIGAAILAYLIWAARIARGMDDALGLTTTSEIIRIGLNLVAMAALMALYYAGILNLALLFCHQYALYLALFGGYLWCLRGAWPGFSFRLEREKNRAYTREFADYCLPLLTLALASVVFLAGERWLLQYFDGSAAQGYFSLSQKVGMACFLFVTAMTPLIMREFSLAHVTHDVKRMAALLDRHGPMLYAVAAYFSCFAAVEAEAVVRILGGDGFDAAVLPVRIMALYPMHQSYGQLVGSLFYATGETRVLRNNTIASLVTGIAATWIMLAPARMCGLDLGAVGLAVKMVAVQCLFANILLVLARRTIPLNLTANLVHQAVCPALFLGLSWLCGAGAAAAGLTGLIRFFASGVAYTAACTVLVSAMPRLGGLSRHEVRYVWARIGDAARKIAR